MPLKARELGNLNEEPLAGDVFEAGLDNTQLHGALNEVGRRQDPGNKTLSSRNKLTAGVNKNL